MENIINKGQELLALYGLKLVFAIAIFVVGRIVAKGVRGLVDRLLRKSSMDATLVRFVTNLAYIGIMTFVIIAALGQLGVKTASLVAVVGAATLAIGLALQGSLANFAAGVLMLVFRPIAVGDYVEGGGVAGTVEEITIFTTQLVSPDNKVIIVPNASITGGNIVNYSAKDQRRVDMVVGVGYGDDLKKVKETIADVLSQDERIAKDPATTIAVCELGDSSVNFAVRPWVKTADYWAVKFDTLEALKLRFDKEGISIPFPQQDVHMFQEKA